MPKTTDGLIDAVKIPLYHAQGMQAEANELPKLPK